METIRVASSSVRRRSVLQLGKFDNATPHAADETSLCNRDDARKKVFFWSYQTSERAKKKIAVVQLVVRTRTYGIQIPRPTNIVHSLRTLTKPE